MKRKIIKFSLYLVVIVILGIGLLLTYTKTMLPDVGAAPKMKVKTTPERIARGKYLANNVMACIDCHSKRDWSKFSGPLVEGTEGQGGDEFNQDMGFPGRFVAANITPANIGNWTDGELFRVITTGVSKDGRALFPVMPYHKYGELDPEDIKSVIAYIRTLKPIKYSPNKSEPDFPMNFIVNTIPKEAKLKQKPPESDTINYGKYLVTAGACGDCHTKKEKGEIVGKPLAGGMEFKWPDGTVTRASNITPHMTGIGNWDEETFIMRFKSYQDSVYTPEEVNPGEFQTIMPWTLYADMKTEDLKAIYAYLKTVKPVNNVVTRFSQSSEE